MTGGDRVAGAVDDLRVERLDVSPPPPGPDADDTELGTETGTDPDADGETEAHAHAPAGPDVDAVTRDLMTLRKGRGLQTPGLAPRLGPALLSALDLRTDLAETELRRRAQAGIVEAAQALPGDLREAVLVALAVDGWTNVPLLTDRLDAVAVAMDRDARTARRRVDAATRQLADALVTSRVDVENPFAPPGWYVESLASTLRVGPAGARLTEDRVVVADTDGLDTVTATLSLPAPVSGRMPELDITAEAGCRIRGAHHVSQSHWRYELALPHPLRAGEAHRYVVSFSVPDRDLMRPYYTLIPLRRTRRFSAEIRFADPAAVELAWRLDGVPPAVLEDAAPTTRILTPDDAGVIRVRFEPVVQGLCYGVQWRWAAPAG